MIKNILTISIWEFCEVCKNIYNANMYSDANRLQLILSFNGEHFYGTCVIHMLQNEIEISKHLVYRNPEIAKFILGFTETIQL